MGITDFNLYCPCEVTQHLLVKSEKNSDYRSNVCQKDLADSFVLGDLDLLLPKTATILWATKARRVSSSSLSSISGIKDIRFFFIETKLKIHLSIVCDTYPSGQLFHSKSNITDQSKD